MKRKKKKRGDAEQLRKRQKALLMFLDGATISEIARELGVSRQTIWHWRAKDDWDEELMKLTAPEMDKFKKQVTSSRLRDLRNLMDALQSQISALLKRINAGESEDIPLSALSRMIVELKELVAREAERLEPDIQTTDTEVEVEWHA